MPILGCFFKSSIITSIFCKSIFLPECIVVFKHLFAVERFKIDITFVTHGVADIFTAFLFPDFSVFNSAVELF